MRPANNYTMCVRSKFTPLIIRDSGFLKHIYVSNPILCNYVGPACISSFQLTGSSCGENPINYKFHCPALANDKILERDRDRERHKLLLVTFMSSDKFTK